MHHDRAITPRRCVPVNELVGIVAHVARSGSWLQERHGHLDCPRADRTRLLEYEPDHGSSSFGRPQWSLRSNSPHSGFTCAVQRAALIGSLAVTAYRRKHRRLPDCIPSMTASHNHELHRTRAVRHCALCAVRGDVTAGCCLCLPVWDLEILSGIKLGN
jgi:hypothetical protein